MAGNTFLISPSPINTTLHEHNLQISIHIYDNKQRASTMLQHTYLPQKIIIYYYNIKLILYIKKNVCECLLIVIIKLRFIIKNKCAYVVTCDF